MTLFRLCRPWPTNWFDLCVYSNIYTTTT